MKQNTLFNYLKTTIKSDSKPPQTSNKNPTPEKKTQFHEVPSSPASNLKSQKKLVSIQEEKDLQRAIDESLKISQNPPSSGKNFKRLKKTTDIEAQDQPPTKLPPKIDQNKKSSFLEPEEKPMNEEERQLEIEKVIENLSKEELEFNFEKFRFSKGDKPQNSIETLFKQRKEKAPQEQKPSQPNKPSVNKYIIDEEKQDNTDVLTEELNSDPDEDFFTQLNKPKNQSSSAKQQDPPKRPIEQSRNPQDQKKIQEQLKKALDQHKKPDPKPSFLDQSKKTEPKPFLEKKEAQPPKRSFTSISIAPASSPNNDPKKQDHKNKSSTPQKDNESSGNKNKKTFWGNKQNKSTNQTPINMNGPLNKMTFVITGLLDGCDRETLENIIKSEGGKINSNVSGKTSYLIVGSKLEDGRDVESSSKYRKAIEHKTKLLKENDLDDFLFNKTGKRLSDHVSQAMQQTFGMPIGTNLTTTDNNNPGPTKPSPQKNFQSYLGASFAQKKPSPSPTKNNDTSNTAIDNNKNNTSTHYTSTELWTHKYAPQNLGQLIGNNDSIKKIADWLKDWNTVVLKGEKKSSQVKGSAWGNAPNLNARACLISGPPGIGKTTSIRVLTKQLNYQLIEKNASDIRNKNSINTLLGVLKSNVLIGDNNKGIKRNFVILMDEVDGMSSDRGGSAALIEIIKTTKVPIICICNDRQHPKMRTLSNHCYDIRFHKPQKQTIAKKVGEICANEGLSIDSNSLELLCESLGNDIRQILNVVEMMKRKGKDVKFYDMKNQISGLKKDDTVMLSNFDAAGKLMNRMENKKMDLREKLDLFFIDYELIPLLIQENYLNACSRDMNLETLVKTAESISFGDNILTSIRRNNDWGLMPNFGFASVIYPTFLSSNAIPFPKFPEFLGKNSTQRKVMREIKELRFAMGPVITGNKSSIKFDYGEALLKLILFHMVNDGSDVNEALNVMEHYQITPELLKENLVDIQYNPKKLDLLHEIPTQTKSSLTRLYNKLHKDYFRGKKGGKKTNEGEVEIEGMKDPLYEEGEKNIDEEDGGEEEKENEEMKEEEEVEGTKAKAKKKTEKKTGEASKRGKKK